MTFETFLKYLIAGSCWLATNGLTGWLAYRQAKKQDITDRIQPFQEAADGWRQQANQLQSQINTTEQACNRATSERDSLKAELAKLKDELVETGMVNRRLQGEVDLVRREMREFGTMREAIASVLAELKSSNS